MNDVNTKEFNERDYPLRAMGISNKCVDTENRVTDLQLKSKNGIYSIQFYDFDFPNGETKLTQKQVQNILEIFPYDCFCYETLHGMHFISLALLKGLRITKTRAFQKSKEFLNQDYWTKFHYLTLRVSGKWKTKFLKIFPRKKYKVMSPKPVFFGLIKEPRRGIKISGKHLEFYKKHMDLPTWVWKKYIENCNVYNLDINLYHYATKE